jgi:moderate conductance mechanosensitive channel
LELSIIKEYFINNGLNIIITIIILISAKYIINFIIKTIYKLLLKARISETMNLLLIDIARFLLWIIIFSLIFNILGLNEISMALGGSIAILGLGLIKSIGNVAGDLIAGIFLIMDDDFNKGTYVYTSGIEGRVESLDIRKTKIVDNKGKIHIIPNKKIDSNILIIDKDK